VAQITAQLFESVFINEREKARVNVDALLDLDGCRSSERDQAWQHIASHLRQRGRCEKHAAPRIRENIPRVRSINQYYSKQRVP
jgi:hypothetical protein